MADIFKADMTGKERVIDPSSDPSRQLTVFERKLLQVQQEADEIREQAKREAEGYIAKAKAEAAAITEKAYHEGIEKGKGESIAKIGELAGSLRKEIEALQNTQVELMRKCRTSIMDFSLKLAKLIIGQEIKSNPAFVEKQLERIFERLSVDGKVEIHVSTEDFETIETFMRESGAGLAPDGYEIHADPSLKCGGIKVDASTMGIDGSLEGMLRRVETVVLDMLNCDG